MELHRDFIFFRACVRYSCLASPSSLNATLKDEQKLASGDFWSRDICCFSCSRPRHWRGKRRRRSSKLPALEVISYHFHSGHVEPTGGLRVELIPVCIVVEASRLHISLETSSSASAASCGPSWVFFCTLSSDVVARAVVLFGSRSVRAANRI